LTISTDSGYRSAEKFAREHYENFPVISFLIKKEERKHVSALYWFARKADDIADEGNLPDIERVHQLDEFELRLTSLIGGNVENHYEAALSNTINKKKINPQLFYDLISAFRQDLQIKKYKTFSDILDYCKRSANPVGRILLAIHGIYDESAYFYSDKICTALQLINFYQDVKVDYSRGRLYFPLDELSMFSVTEKMFELNKINHNLEKLVKYSIDRADLMLEEGKELLEYLSGRLKVEIKWTLLGGKEILNKIRQNEYNIFTRPKLSKLELVNLLRKSII
jgi:squalene synthase HpnC